MDDKKKNVLSVRIEKILTTSFKPNISQCFLDGLKFFWERSNDINQKKNGIAIIQISRKNEMILGKLYFKVRGKNKKELIPIPIKI